MKEDQSNTIFLLELDALTTYVPFLYKKEYMQKEFILFPTEKKSLQFERAIGRLGLKIDAQNLNFISPLKQ